MCIGCTYVHVCEPHVVVEYIPVMYYQMNNICVRMFIIIIIILYYGQSVKWNARYVGGWVDGAFQKILNITNSVLSKYKS